MDIEANFEFIEPKEEIDNEETNNSTNFLATSTKCGDIMIIENNEFLLTCIVCNKDFRSLKGFSYHYIREHFESNEIISKDISVNEEIDCESKYSVTNINSNKTIHSLEEENDLQTDKTSKSKCNIKRRSQNKLLKSNFICKNCGRQCPNQSYLLRHIASHTSNPERPFKCQYCPKAFNYRNHLNRHETLHTKDPVYECDYCYSKFSRSDNKKVHELRHTDEEKELVAKYGKKLAGLKNKSKQQNSEQQIDEHEDDSVPEGYWRCNICEKILKNTYKQEEHQRLHTGEKPFICDICGKGMISQTHLNHHILVHNQDRRYKCTQCPAGFYSSAHLRRHEISAHSPEKPFKCDTCGVGFGRKEHLTSHHLTHDKNRIKNYKCDVCENSYYDANALRIHKKKHSAITEGPFLCNICPAGFQLKEALKRHEKRHTNKGLYKCDYCEKRFNDKDDKNQHEKRCHLTKQDDQNPLIQCDQCDLKFIKKFDFKQHYNSFHQNNVYHLQIRETNEVELQHF